MQPEGSLPHSQAPATCPPPEPDQSKKIPYTNILPSTPMSSKWSLSSGIPTKTLFCTDFIPKHATCSVHLIAFYLILWVILSEVYRSLSSSLCTFLHSHTTSSFLGRNILIYCRKPSACVPLSKYDRPSFKPIKAKGKVIVLRLLIQRFQLVSLSPEINDSFPIHTFLRMDLFQFKMQWKFSKLK